MSLAPKMYYKNIYEINYQKLKKMGIKDLIFDLDNTIAIVDTDNAVSDAVIVLFENLKKDFNLYIISNNKEKRVKVYEKIFNVPTIHLAMKPLPIGLRRLRKLQSLKKSEMCMIGDQIVTDVISGKLYNIYTILVDPLGEKDLRITSLNRKIENIIFKKSKRIKKGKYYDE